MRRLFIPVESAAGMCDHHGRRILLTQCVDARVQRKLSGKRKSGITVNMHLGNYLVFLCDQWESG